MSDVENQAFTSSVALMYAGADVGGRSEVCLL
jgi:hypothetical protein